MMKADSKKTLKAKKMADKNHTKFIKNISSLRIKKLKSDTPKHKEKTYTEVCEEYDLLTCETTENEDIMVNEISHFEQ